MSSPLYGNVGAIEVRALDWAKPEDRQVEGGPWDYILAAGTQRRHPHHWKSSLINDLHVGSCRICAGRALSRSNPLPDGQFQARLPNL